MEHKKGLESIIYDINTIIKKENIQPGQKLPSERNLKDQLNVSRQSVREALRALELLGIIHVKRGEGTYLTHIDDHQLFNLIGHYLIQSKEQLDDLNEIIYMFDEYAKTYNSDVLSYDNKIMKKIYILLNKYHSSIQLEKE